MKSPRAGSTQKPITTRRGTTTIGGATMLTEVTTEIAIEMMEEEKTISKMNHINTTCIEHVDLETTVEMNTRRFARHGWKPKAVKMQRIDAKWPNQGYADSIIGERYVADTDVNMCTLWMQER